MQSEAELAELVAAKLSEAQRAFLLKGDEGIYVDRRIARSLCEKRLMGIAGYVVGEAVYAFTHKGLAVREVLMRPPVR